MAKAAGRAELLIQKQRHGPTGTVHLRFDAAYTRFVDVWDAVDRLADIMATGAWRDPAFTVRRAVT